MRPPVLPIALLLTATAVASCDDEPPAAAPPAVASAAERMCAAMAATLDTCATPSACEEALAADCADVAGIFSDAFLEAMAACLEDANGFGACVLGALEGLTPTTAHAAFADQFCSSCALGVPGCAETLFEGSDGQTQAAGMLLRPLSDALVNELATECASSIGCLATFSSCAQGVIVARGIPENTATCLVGALTGGGDGACSDEGSGGAGGAGGAGGGADTSGSGGAGGGLVCTDPDEVNDEPASATLLDADGDGKLSDCEPGQTIDALLAGPDDEDWYSYVGLDMPCGLDDIQPHAYVDADEPLMVCVYIDPLGSSAPPTCLEGADAGWGDSYTGCCGQNGARLKFGATLQFDDANVLIRVSSPTAPESCIDYSLSYRFGK